MELGENVASGLQSMPRPGYITVEKPPGGKNVPFFMAAC